MEKYTFFIFKGCSKIFQNVVDCDNINQIFKISNCLRFPNRRILELFSSALKVIGHTYIIVCNFSVFIFLDISVYKQSERFLSFPKRLNFFSSYCRIYKICKTRGFRSKKFTQCPFPNFGNAMSSVWVICWHL